MHQKFLLIIVNWRSHKPGSTATMNGNSVLKKVRLLLVYTTYHRYSDGPLYGLFDSPQMMNEVCYSQFFHIYAD